MERSRTETPERAERTERWSGADLLAALGIAVSHFEPFVPELNALNVFPVPDGDTGTNMYLTLQAAEREAARRAPRGDTGAGEMLAAAAQGALMGARGNSGVILYQALAGLAEALAHEPVVTGAGLAAGLSRAGELVYQAVLKPVEGTMLTVIREAGVAARRAAETKPAIGPVLDAALAGAEAALARTPEQLPILRQAGVVDAGGRGVVVLLAGLRAFLSGETLQYTAVQPAEPVARSMSFLDIPEIVHDAGEFGYCTNFVLTGASLPLEAFRERMSTLGRSAVVVGDQQTIKVHIHGDHPGQILEAALEYGELQNVRIDNMSAQTRALLAERQQQPEPAQDSDAQAAGLAVVAVAGGEGLATALRGMGASAIVLGGPTVNPSTEEILRVVERLPNREIILLPNDKNVIPTARQVAALTGKQVRVVPSESIPQAISALSALNLDASLDKNVAEMTAALPLVRSLALTRATREVELDGLAVRQGDFIGLLDGALRAAGVGPAPVMTRLLELAGAGSAELATLFTGEPADDALVAAVSAAIAARFPALTIEVAPGGQPHYHLLVALE
ncbi:MAG TPA: DAK2 domain-containing protein [Thermomicrobiaceae bacterium]|nr:DAK2 domain-containing protein [Thermomicrobiaceae bacterium]